MRTGCVAGMLIAAGLSSAQKAPATFEAVVIHPEKPQGGLSPGMTYGCHGGPGTSLPGEWECRGANLAMLIAEAYELNAIRIPEWDHYTTDFYDVFAKVSPGATRTELHEMQRQFLADRFHLKVHTEQKLLPVYRLTVAKGGMKMRESSPATHVEQPEAGVVGKFTMDAHHLPQFPQGRGGMIGLNGRFHWVASDLDSFGIAKKLEGALNAVVRDETGLTGKYDVDLAWTNQTLRAAPEGAASDPDELPSIETAVRQKLGLQLTRAKDMVDVLLIDHAEKPVIE